jgi:hypothetical protein
MLFWLQALSLMPETSTRRFIILFCCPLLQLVVAVSSLTNLSELARRRFTRPLSWVMPAMFGVFLLHQPTEMRERSDPSPPATLAYMILVLPCVDRFDRRANPKHMGWIDTFLLSNGRTPLDMVRERLEATPTLPHGESEDRRLTTKLYHLLTIPQPS